jgi:ABC-type transport system involved in multi-copper enzyme maturation permease subunit
MFLRVFAICYNTYREAVRARILHGLLGLAVGTCGYALIVGAYALRNQNRVVADLGAASISLYATMVAIILGATSLYRELELKTIFPILARPIARGEYLVGKFLGTLLTLTAFVAINSGLLLFAVGALTSHSVLVSLAVPSGIILSVGGLAWKFSRLRTWAPIPLGVLLLSVGAYFGRDGVSESGVILGQALLTVLEVSIISALTLVFASFSSPFLTAIFTLSVFLVGRSADTLARLPEQVFGAGIKRLGEVLSQVFPNLMVYAPPRALLTGEAVGVSYWPYVGSAAVQSLAWTIGLLVFAAIIFRRRDFL